MSGHVSVLLAETIEALAPKGDALYCDGTFGGGGVSAALLEAAPCTVVAIDRDPAAVKRGDALKARFPGRLTVVEGRFSEMESLLAPLGIASVNGVTLDLGVSSQQLDESERGFSFRADGPLDMRMERQGQSAADLVNAASERELARIIRDFGEERHAGRVARAIVRERERGPITRTAALAELVRKAVPASGTIDAATRTFQALRIAVNDELGELGRGLGAAERMLVAGGRLAVVSFHSLEDRAVKTFLRDRSAGAARGSRHLPEAETRAPSFRLVARKPVGPGEAEIAHNPRARSARLRSAERTDAPSWEDAA